ncbi:MAG: cell division protein ZapB [candidate division Zixibacteria bacterium]|nr:cell division protein ZapB [candidate division Zixibacteria bacterium]
MDALEMLEAKITKALDMIEKLKEENGVLKKENRTLKTQLDEARSRLTVLEQSEQEKTEKIKGRLSHILEKLDALEQVAVD